MEAAFFLVLALAVATVAGDPCIQGWSYYNGACYGIGDTAVTWVDAEDICYFQNGKLAEIETLEENNFLKNLSKTHQISSAWLGGTDIFDEGNWVWMSTQQHIYPFTDWADGQPNDFNGEDCLLLWQSLDYQWADASCNELHNFLCEAETREPVIG